MLAAASEQPAVHTAQSTSSSELVEWHSPNHRKLAPTAAGLIVPCQVSKHQPATALQPAELYLLLQSFGPAAERPVVEKFEDELDQWGRPKKRQANPIDVMPEDQQQKAYEQLEKQLEKEERRARG